MTPDATVRLAKRNTVFDVATEDGTIHVSHNFPPSTAGVTRHSVEMSELEASNGIFIEMKEDSVVLPDGTLVTAMSPRAATALAGALVKVANEVGARVAMGREADASA